MSACRKSWATVSPCRTARPTRGYRRWSRSERARRATAARAPSDPATASRTAWTCASNGSASSPRAARAAALAAGSSWSSAASSRSMRVVTTPGTSPSVSTSRPRAPSSVTYGTAATSASRTSPGSCAANDSSVAWARVPAKPPSRTRSTRPGRAAATGEREPNVHAACSRRNDLSWYSRAASRSPGSFPGRSASAWTAEIAAIWSDPSAIARSRSRIAVAGSPGVVGDGVRRDDDRLDEGRREVAAPDQFGANRLAHAHELALRRRLPDRGSRLCPHPYSDEVPMTDAGERRSRVRFSPHGSGGAGASRSDGSRG